MASAELWLAPATIALGGVLTLMSALTSAAMDRLELEQSELQPHEVLLSTTYSRKKLHSILRTFGISTLSFFLVALTASYFLGPLGAHGPLGVLFCLGIGVAFGSICASFSTIGASLPLSHALTEVLAMSDSHSKRAIVRAIDRGKSEHIGANEINIARQYAALSLVLMRFSTLQFAFTYLGLGLILANSIRTLDSESYLRILTLGNLVLLSVGAIAGFPFQFLRYRRIRAWVDSHGEVSV
jgi:hypothetical protein